VLSLSAMLAKQKSEALHYGVATVVWPGHLQWVQGVSRNLRSTLDSFSLGPLSSFSSQFPLLSLLLGRQVQPPVKIPLL